MANLLVFQALSLAQTGLQGRSEGAKNTRSIAIEVFPPEQSAFARAGGFAPLSKRTQMFK